MREPSLASYRRAIPDFLSSASSPREFLEKRLHALTQWEPLIGVFVSLNLPGARAAADESTARWRSGCPLSPIDGMPIAVKDVIETADMPTQQGSALFAGWRMGRDAASVAALREAGAVILGKTVTTEFAATEPRGTRNPWDPKRTPGGSSSGSAAAVAAGLVSAGLGTQVIGSIIRPASYCGCFGYKPSVGGLNRGGSFDTMSQSCAGVLAASLEELWTVARAISARAGGDPGYAGLSGPLEPPPMSKPTALAVLETVGWSSATAESRLSLDVMIERLRRAGVAIITRSDSALIEKLELAIESAGSLSRGINAWESRWPLNTYARDMDRSGLSEAMRKRLAQAEAMNLEDYQGLLGLRKSARELYSELRSICDGCITLSAPGAAPVGLQSTGDPTFAIPASLLGVPALSLPILEAEGLPLGLQMIGFKDEDARLFSAAAWLLHARTNLGAGSETIATEVMQG